MANIAPQTPGLFYVVFDNENERLSDIGPYTSAQSVAGGSASPIIAFQADTAHIYYLEDHSPITWVSAAVVPAVDINAGVTDEDAAPGVLSDKLSEGSGITFTIINPGDNEQLEIGADAVVAAAAAAQSAADDAQSAADTAQSTAEAAQADIDAHTAAGSTNALTEKTSPVGADVVEIEDSAASYAKKKISLSKFLLTSAGTINSLTAKNPPAGTDQLLVEDSADSYAQKKTSVSNFFQTANGTINALSSKSAPVSGDVIVIEDSAASYAQKKIALSALAAGIQVGVQWDPDAPPSSGHAQDDEFDDDLSGWTEFDPSADLTTSINNGFAILDSTTTTSPGHLVGIYKAVPAVANWAMVAKFTLVQRGSTSSNVLQGGIFVSQDLGAAPTTADFYIARSAQPNGTGGSPVVETATLTAYDASASVVKTVSQRTQRTVYFRLRVTSTTVLAWDWSDDGKGWVEISTATWGSTPVHCGIFIRNTSGNNGYGLFEFVRFYEGTVNIQDMLPGGRTVGKYL